MNIANTIICRLERFFKETDKVLILSVAIFSALLLPCINSIPYLDGNVEFRMSYDFYFGGFEKYKEDFSGSLHPPFKLFVAAALFKILGFSAFSYNLIGLFFGIAGIIAVYLLAEKIFDKKTARISSLLLSAFPLFIAAGIFSLLDYILAILMAVSLLFFVKRNYLGYAVSSSFLVLTKEYGLILPCAIILVEIFYIFAPRKAGHPEKPLNMLALLAPLAVSGAWYSFLNINGLGEWNGWNFSETGASGAFYTVLHNFITLNIFNKYAFQQWSQLFLLNFNWVYWAALFLGLGIFVSDSSNREKIKSDILAGDSRTKALMAVFVVFIVYVLCVLSFQTFTIPRYALGLYPLLIIFTAFSINKITDKFPFSKYFVYIVFFLVICTSLFFSVDPVSRSIWPIINATDNNEVYDLIGTGGGPDAVAYNSQYLLLVKRRTDAILSEGQDKYPGICGWMFEDVRSMEMIGIKFNESMCG